MLYGAELWGSENCDILERLQLRFYKYVLSVSKFTSSMMVYGELGAVPLDIDNKLRMLTYWARLCLGDKHKESNTIYSLSYTLDENKIFKSERARLCLGDKHKESNTIYSLSYTLDENKIFKSEWIQTVKTTLNYWGFSGFWLNQTRPCSMEAFKQSVKLRLKDQLIQK